MLSLAKLGSGGGVVAYLEQMVAQGVEEYYSNAREAPGQWLGDSLERLGLDGVIEADEFRRVLAHAHPHTGARLTAAKSVPKVVGLDATFCAPKSVSLLYALGKPEVSNEVRNAHDVALNKAFDVLQSLARGRRDHDGVRLVEGDGLIGAAYRHRTSRAAEPHLHTHVVIPNLVYAPEDGRWSALDARPLYAWAKPVGHLYRAQLRYELTTRLGVRWNPPVKGLAEIAGFDPRVLRAFSTRRQEIERELADSSRHGAKAAQQAAYKTRAPKDLNLDGAQLLDAWRERAVSLGLDNIALSRILGREHFVRLGAVGSIATEELFAALASPDGLTAHRSTFDIRHVIEGICDRLPNGAPIDRVFRLADAFLESPHVLTLAVEHAPALRRGDGRLVPSADETVRFTTAEMVVTEQRLLQRAAARRTEHTGVAHAEHVERAITCRPELSGEQIAMVRSLCSSGAGVEVVEGVAGSGKTFALETARDAWTTSGFQVHGCALAARAAARMEESSGVPSITIDRLLNRLDARRIELTDRDVIVVDEAAMVGTRRLHEVFDHADCAGAKVVLIGDPRQLPEIDAGGAYRALQRALGASELATNRRQVEPWEQDALAHLRAGETARGLHLYRTHERIHEIDDAPAGMVHHWVAGQLTGKPAVMLAAHVRDVEELNQLARRELQHYGRLGPDEIAIGGRPYAVGDQVMALRNDYDLGVLNGTCMTVLYIDGHSHCMNCRTEQGEQRQIPFDYIADGHLAHAYAMTIHKAQGATFERALVLADDTMTAEHAYTALSRARECTDLFVETGDAIERESHAPVIESPVAERLRTSFGRTGSQSLAIDHDPTLVPIDVLRTERARLQATLVGRPIDHDRELRELQQKISSRRQSLEQAMWRQDQAQQRLDRLGPIGRHVHRHDRREFELREQSAAADINRLSEELACFTAEHRELSLEHREVTRWDEAHRPQLDRVGEIDRAIGLHDAAARALERGLTIERGPDRSMGLGL